MADRATYLTQSGIRLLDDWAVSLRHMFPAEVPYLVGSALTRPDFRDVDVRVLLDDDAMRALRLVVVLADLNLAVSLWGQQVTALPIDFQVQHVDEANAEYHGRRHPLGMRVEARPHRSLVVTAGDVYSAMSAAYKAVDYGPVAPDADFEQRVAEALTARLNRTDGE